MVLDDNAVKVTYFNPRTGTFKVPGFSAQQLAERLDFPRVYPIPQSETRSKNDSTRLNI